MRSTILALVASALAATSALAQQPAQAPKHPTTMPHDTAMAGMPGMKKSGSGRDTSRARTRGVKHRRGAPGDTAKGGMQGMEPTGMGMRQPASMAMSMTDPLGIPEAREGSGTSWQPDIAPMYAVGRQAGPWSLMAHGNAFVQYVHEGSARGGRQLGSVNWFMGMARRALVGGDLTLRGMISLEPITVGKCGYPDVLATGESCNGEMLHDRQHPHDMFMEVAAMYQRALTRNLAFEVYGGPAGEPALGPVAFPHRISAMWTSLAPVSHHWQDATHISFGVLTGGLYGRKWKVEGSIFNGREPDENRFDFDLAPLDSYSGRVWFLPSPRVALQASTGFLRQGMRMSDGMLIDAHCTTVSLTYLTPLRSGGLWANTIVWGQLGEQGMASNAGLIETSLDLDGRNVISARAELDQKTGDDLGVDHQNPVLMDRLFRVGKVVLGYTREFGAGSLRPGIGGELSMNFVPSDLKPFYGSTTSAGFAFYASIHPGPMRMAEERAMGPLPAPEHNGAMMAPPDTSHMPMQRPHH